jgi:mono/diheme cytochrome c family protein
MKVRAFGLMLTLGACGEDPDDPCADAPVVTWETFGEGFFLENCQSCHAEEATGPETPDGVTFAEEADIARLRERILDRATGDEPDMPPQGGIDEADRERLRVWLTCGDW